MRSTPRPAKSCGSSILFPRPRAIGPAARKAPRRSTRRLGTTGPDSRSAAARPGRRTRSIPKAGELYVPVGNPSPAYAISVREGENLYTDSVVVLDAMTGAYKRHFKLVPRDWHDWDVASAPALIHTAGRQEPAVGRAQGWTSLWHRPRRQRPPLSHAGDQDRECRGAVCARQSRALLPGRVRRFRVERPGLRSGHEPHHHRRSRLVHDGETADRRAAPGRADRRRLVRQRDAQPV